MNKKQLDKATSILGWIAGISIVLGTNGVISPQIAGTIAGICTVSLGTLTQKPATERPNTEDLEEKNE